MLARGNANEFLSSCCMSAHKKWLKKQKNKVRIGLKLSNVESAVATDLSLWPMKNLHVKCYLGLTCTINQQPESLCSVHAPLQYRDLSLLLFSLWKWKHSIIYHLLHSTCYSMYFFFNLPKYTPAPCILSCSCQASYGVYLLKHRKPLLSPNNNSKRKARSQLGHQWTETSSPFHPRPLTEE